MRVFRGIIASATFVVLLLAASQPAFAVLGGPVTIAASALGYKICMDVAKTKKEKLACASMIFDPPANQVENIAFTLSFDSTRFEIVGDPMFLGDFSLSGIQIPLKLATIGGIQNVEPDPGIDLNLVKQARSGSLVTWVVDNVLGTASLDLDLSANPTPSDASAQNFFGFSLFSKDGREIIGIEYFDTPGQYDVMMTSFECVAIDQSSCGTDHPVIGYNIITAVPEPSTFGMLLSGGLILLLVRRKGKKRTDPRIRMR